MAAVKLEEELGPNLIFTPSLMLPYCFLTLPYASLGFHKIPVELLGGDFQILPVCVQTLTINDILKPGFCRVVEPNLISHMCECLTGEAPELKPRRQILKAISYFIASLLTLSPAVALSQLDPQARQLGIYPTIEVTQQDPEAPFVVDIDAQQLLQEINVQVQNAVAKQGWRIAMGPQEMDIIVRDLAAQGHVCSDPDPDCIAKVGIFAGVDLIVVPQVLHTQQGTVFAISIIDATEARVLSRNRLAASEVDSLFADKLEQTIAKSLADLIPKGQLAVAVQLAGAQILVDGQTVGTSPAPQIGPLLAGEHRVEVKAKGYHSVAVDVTIPPEEVVQLNLALTPERPDSLLTTPQPAAPKVTKQRTSPLVIAGEVVSLTAAAGGVGFAILGITGELSYRIADYHRVDTTSLAARQKKKAQMVGGTNMALAGLLGTATCGLGVLGGGGLIAGGILLDGEQE